MRATFVTPAVLALASVVVADFFDAIQGPAQDAVLPAGVPFELVWTPNGVTGLATITLLQGATNITLQKGPVIAQSIDNTLGKFSWTPEDTGFATYGWQIQLDSDASQLQYSNYFHIKGDKSSSSDVSSTSTVAGSTTTIKLSTGPSYTSSVSSTSTSSSSASSVTKVAANVTSSVTSSTSVPTGNTGNTTLTSVVTSTSSPTTSAASSTSSAPSSSTTPNAAAANVARGGVAVVAALAFALVL